MKSLLNLLRHTATLALGAVLAFCGFQSAQAANKYWDGGGSDLNWGTRENWDGVGNGKLPDTTDDVIFGTAFTSGNAITLNGNRTANSMTIDTSTGISIANNTLILTAGTLTRSLASSGNQTISCAITIGNNANWAIAGSGTLTVSGVVDDGPSTYSVTKAGTGTLILGNATTANTYGGGTTLSAGTLQLGAANAIPSSGIVTFSGGTLAGNNKNDTMGQLSLSANSSTISLNAGGVSIRQDLYFSSATRSSGTLTISGWSGTASGGADSNGDRILFGNNTDSGSFLENVTFANFGTGASFRNIDAAHWELVPVPEPKTIFAGCLLLGIFGWTERRRLGQMFKLAQAQ
jgi:autotransporter-associated beta strand protein